MDMEEFMERLEQMAARQKADREEERRKEKEEREEIRRKEKEERRKDHEDFMAKLDAYSKAWREEMAAEREATQERTAAMREKRLQANMDPWQKEITEVRLEEEKPATADIKPATAQQEEVPIVIPVGVTMACPEMEA
ncbi:hypothetical protein B7P43_G08219, partial [Cryptotermes secundus]